MCCLQHDARHQQASRFAQLRCTPRCSTRKHTPAEDTMHALSQRAAHKSPNFYLLWLQQLPVALHQLEHCKTSLSGIRMSAMSWKLGLSRGSYAKHASPSITTASGASAGNASCSRSTHTACTTAWWDRPDQALLLAAICGWRQHDGSRRCRMAAVTF
jgi:hypothetical protein